MHADAARDAAPVQGRHRRRRPLQEFSIAVQQMVAIARAVSFDAQARHHGRADLLARRARGRGAVRRDPPAQRRGRGRHLHQPQAGRALRGLRPRHDHARRPHRGGERRWTRSAGSSWSPPCSAATWRRSWRRAPATPTPTSHRGSEALLEAEGLAVGRRVQGVSFDGAPGEIVGLAGLLGSGRSETVRAVFGAEPADRRPAGVRRSSAGADRARGRDPRRASASAPRTARPRASSPTCRCART